MHIRFLIIILLVLSIGFIFVDAKAALVATFGDPGNTAATPMFTVDFRPAQNKLTGGWAYGNTGLTLEFYNGHNFENVWFEMTDVPLFSAPGNTGGGEINFYENGSTTGPLLTIIFESGYVDYGNFGANVIFDADGVEFSGSEIIPGTFSEEQYFSFGFVNKTYLPDSTDWNDGFIAATAAFTSSAIPEPTTICLLGFGALTFLRRRRA